MKILFCTNSFEQVSNGPAKFANLVLKINKQYPECSIRILTEDITYEDPEVYKLNLRYPAFLKLFSQFFRIIAYHREAKRIKEQYDFDVIVYNNAFIGLLSAFSFKNSVGMINDDNNATRKIKKWTWSKTFVKQLLFKQFEHAAAKLFSKIIVNSDYLGKTLREEYSIPKEKLFRLYKGVNLMPEIKAKKLDVSQTINILFVKSDYVRGGLADLIIALGKLPFSFLLTIIGPPESAWPTIREWKSKANNITLQLLGVQPQTVVMNALAQANIFCVPARKEALGVANIEALTMGVPVVSTRVGGIPEVLNQGSCGWLAAPNNPEALSIEINQCINNSDLREIKIANGKKHANQFDIENTIENFLEILRR